MKTTFPSHLFRAAKGVALASTFAFGISAYAQSSINLSQLDLSKINQGYGKAVSGKSVSGDPAIAAGKSYSDVIGTHAPSSFKINLHGKAKRLHARVAVGDRPASADGKNIERIALVNGTSMLFANDGNQRRFVAVTGNAGEIERGSVKIVVKGDGKELPAGGVVRGGESPMAIDLDLKGINTLELIAETTPDGPSGDNVLWIEPVIEYEGEAPVAVDAASQEKGPEMTLQAKKRLESKIRKLPVMTVPASTLTGYDWLLTPGKTSAAIYATPDRKSIVVANDMVSRTFRIFPNLATTDFVNRMTGESLLRAVSSEGSVTIDGKEWSIGGLEGQPERAYIKEAWIDSLVTVANSFMVEDFEIHPITEDIKWARSRWALNKKAPTGKEITFTLRGDKELTDARIRLSVAVYDGIPVIRNRFTLENGTGAPINVDSFKVEFLAMAEPESPGGGDPRTFLLPNIHVESDYACGGTFTEKETDITEKWVTDPRYTSQRNWLMQTPCILEVSPKIGPDQLIDAGDLFRSFGVYEMPFDSYDRERKGLFTRNMYRTIAPWTTENPIFMHLTSTDPEVVKTAVDQCADTGYEMIILSFGSGLNAEDVSDENIARFKSLVDYARSKGIDMGCYSLLASRWISDDVDVINPATGKRGGMTFGSSPCLSSDWGHEYFRKIKTFFEKTGMKCFEHDGSYPGDVCASTTHTYHKGLNDSQWNQFQTVTALYHWMCENGIYLNVPDFYFLNGSTKVGIGYREANWSLPRERQLIQTRQRGRDRLLTRVSSTTTAPSSVPPRPSGASCPLWNIRAEERRPPSNRSKTIFSNTARLCSRTMERAFRHATAARASTIRLKRARPCSTS